MQERIIYIWTSTGGVIEYTYRLEGFNFPCMKDRNVCVRCQIPPLYGLTMVSCASTIDRAENYPKYRVPAMLRQGMDSFSLFHNTFTLISNIVGSPNFECPDCEYVEMLNNPPEEGEEE